MDITGSRNTCHVFNNGPEYRKRYSGEGNVIDFSSFRALHTGFTSYNFSVKYVVRGIERYRLKRNHYPVRAGRYLLTNAFTSGEVMIDSDKDVDGVCIELAPALLAEVMAILHQPENVYPDSDIYDFLVTADFFECDYDAGKTRLGRYLQQGIPRLSAQMLKDELFLAQFFYGLAENLLADQREVYRYFHTMEQVKAGTRKELLLKLMRGKELIDDCYAEKLNVTDIAHVAGMSEYYFLRLFRNTFGMSPYQYVVERRLRQAHDMLCKSAEQVITIAYACGYSDIHAFSKAYKRRFGRSPSGERNSG